jgi:hypothetical protein
MSELGLATYILKTLMPNSLVRKSSTLRLQMFHATYTIIAIPQHDLSRIDSWPDREEQL